MRSLWREFEFWLMVVQNSIVPGISILGAIENWVQIRENLMESPRKRQLQYDSIAPFI